MGKKFSIFIVLIALIVFTGSPLFAGEIKSITLDVTGMTCKACPKVIKKAVSRVEGVSEVDVSYKEKEARVKFDPDETNAKEIITAVKKAGYGASLKSEGP